MRKVKGNTPMPEIIGVGEKEARTLAEIAFRFFQSYDEKPEDMSDKVWLADQLARELPKLSLEEADNTAERLITGIDDFERDMASLEEACRHGQSKEEWFRDQSQLAAIGMNVNDYGNRLANIDRSLFMANCQLLRLIAAQDGKSIQRFALDSFLAEQCHVVSFNAHAAKVGSPYRAEIFVPDFGHGYDESTPDVVIKDIRSGRKIHSYRVKFGGREEIGDLAQDGAHNTPWIVVASEQLKEMRAVFPRHVFTDRIGGTDKVPVMSDALTEAAVWDEKTLERYPIRRDDWNSYSTREVALHLGRNAVLTGDGTAVFTLPHKTDAAFKIILTGISQIALDKIAPKISLTGITDYCGFDAMESVDRANNGIELLEHTEKAALATLYFFFWRKKHTMQGISLLPMAMAITGSIASNLTDKSEYRITDKERYLDICKTSIKNGLRAVRRI